jgi:hypothetical protein
MGWSAGDVGVGASVDSWGCFNRLTKNSPEQAL